VYNSYEKIDKVLQFYVRLAEETGNVSPSVTLNIHGLILTGSIITASQYFDEMTKPFSQARIRMRPESDLGSKSKSLHNTTATADATPTILHEYDEGKDSNESENLGEEVFTEEDLKDRLVEVKDTMISELIADYNQFIDKMKQEEDHSIHDDGSPSS
jgi:hypothetical protein